MMSCTKEKETFTNICIRKKQMSALKSNVKRGRYPVIKNPSRDKVKCGRSNETKLWETHQGYMRRHHVSRLLSVLTLFPTLSQLLKDVFKV